MTMSSFTMTRVFQEAFGLGNHTAPRIPTVEERILRAKLLMEETLETINKGLKLDCFAVSAGIFTEVVDLEFEVNGAYDPIETLDGLADVKVIANGTAALFGLPMEEADRLVFESNMSKLGEDGKPIVNAYIPEGNETCLLDPTQPVGKVLKGPNFRVPRIDLLLESKCEAHVAKAGDPMTCGRCGVKQEDLRP